MSDYTTRATVELEVNGQKAKQAIEEQKQLIHDLEVAYAKAATSGDKISLKKFDKELKNARKELRQMQSTATNVADVLRRLDTATPTELKNTLRQLNKELNQIERGSQAWNEHVQKIQAVKKELASVNSTLDVQRSKWQKLTDWINRWQTLLLGAVAGVSGLVGLGKKAVQAYADMEQEEANVRKYTGMTAEQVADLNEEFKKMDTRTSREDLNKLAQEAGRLGKTSKEDVLGFVRAADQINVALDDLGEGATLTLSKLTGIFGDEERLGTEKSLLAVGSVINELSQNCSASAPYLAEFTSRMGGVGSQAGMTIQQIMGFAAVLDSNNQKVEASATALSQVITRLYQDPAKYAKPAGLEVQSFTKLLREDANAAIILLLESLNKMGNMDVLSPIFAEMGENGSRAISALSTLAGNIEDVKKQQEVANVAFAEATSVGKEFDVQNNTVQAGLDKAKKNFNELAVDLGEKLLPIMRYAISGTSLMIRLITTIIDFSIKYKDVIITLTAAIVAYHIAVNIAVIKTKLHAFWLATCKVATSAFTIVTQSAAVVTALFQRNLHKATIEFKILCALMKVSPIGMVVAGITALSVGLYALTKRTNEASEAQKTLDNIRKDAQQKLVDEKTNIDLLVSAAKNEKLSLDERKKAIDKLNGIIPNYNAQLDETTGKYVENKKALDDYLSSLVKKYEIEGAKAQLQEIGAERAKKYIELANAQEQTERDDATASRIRNTHHISNNPDVVFAANMGADIIEYNAQDRINDIIRDIEILNEKEKRILAVYGVDLQKDAVSDSDGSSIVGGGGVDDDTSNADRFKAEQEWREREEALNRISYATGQKSYEDYRKRIDEIAVEYYKKLMNHTEASAGEQLQFKAQYYDALQKQQETNNAISLEQLNAENTEIEAAIKQRYLDGLMTTEEYNEAIELNELRHKAEVVDIYKEGTQERMNAEKDYQDAQFRYMLRRQKETQQKIDDFQKKYQQQSAAERIRIELEALKALYDQKLIKEDEYQKARAIIANEYLGKYREEHATPKEKLAKAQKDKGENEDLLATAFEEGLISAEEYQRRMAELTADMHRTIADGLKNTGNEWITMFANVYESFTGFIASLKGDSTGMLENLSKLVGATSAVVVAGMQVSSQFAQAEADIQIAALEKRYEKEISLAEGNSYKVKKLEKQKEKETAKIKNEANKKQFSAQVVQAIAQSITAGLNAYASTLAIPVVGPVLAPAAMALAVATGMMQVALLKKQQKAAEAQGYASGGFTPKGGKYEPAGIVHKGEWVASQELLASPVARPMIEALDYAQRTNTIGSLKADDVSRTITATTIIASSNDGNAVSESLTAQAVALAGYVNVIRRLNERLDEPFVTVNTVTGDAGIKKAQDDYDKLIRNKTPKSKR